MKNILVLISLMFIIGCEIPTHTELMEKGQYSIACVDGVKYLIGGSITNTYMAVKFNKDGQVELCEKKF